MDQDTIRLRDGVRRLLEMLAPDEKMISSIETADEAKARLIDLSRDLLSLVSHVGSSPDDPEMSVRSLLAKLLNENIHLNNQVTQLQKDGWEKLEEIRSLKKALSEQMGRYDKLAHYLGDR